MLAEGGCGVKHHCGPSLWTWGLWRRAPYSSPTHGTHRSLPVGWPLPLGLRLWATLWPPAAWPADPASGPSLPSLPASAPTLVEGPGHEPSHREEVAPIAVPSRWRVKVCFFGAGSRWGPVARDLHLCPWDSAAPYSTPVLAFCPCTSASSCRQAS